MTASRDELLLIRADLQRLINRVDKVLGDLAPQERSAIINQAVTNYPGATASSLYTCIQAKLHQAGYPNANQGELKGALLALGYIQVRRAGGTYWTKP